MPIPLSINQLERYSRSILLDRVEVKGQRAICNSSALVCGAGGLASPAILNLAAAGMGKLHIIDADTISLSNLQRQTLYSSKEVGLPKAQLAAQKAMALNPEVVVGFTNAATTSMNFTAILALANEHDYIIDLTDSVESRRLMSQIAHTAKKPFFSAAAIGMAGHLYAFKSYLQGAPCYGCVFPEVTTDSQCESCAELGVFPTVPGIIGMMLVNAILQEVARLALSSPAPGPFPNKADSKRGSNMEDTYSSIIRVDLSSPVPKVSRSTIVKERKCTICGGK